MSIRIQPPKPTTLVDVLEQHLQRSADAPVFGEWSADGYRLVTYADFARRVKFATSMLARAGVKRGDRVGICLGTSLAFEVAQFAALYLGSVVVGLDPRDTDAALCRAIELAEITGIIVDDVAAVARVSRVRSQLRWVIECHDSEPAHWIRSSHGRSVLDASSAEQALPFRPGPGDLATIVFTSGSTGEPKGLGYRHDQLLLAAEAIAAQVPWAGPGSKLLAWLPMSALFQRMINYAGLVVGATTYFVESPREVMSRARLVSPIVFVGVPMFFQKLRATIMARASSGPRWRRWLVEGTLSLCRYRGRAKRQRRSMHAATSVVASAVAGSLLRRFREAFGSDLRAIVTGSAPMPLTLHDELEGVGIPVLEAYALSECIVPIAMTGLETRRAGTVGHPLLENDVRLAGDGEVLVRSPGVACTSIGAPLALTSDGFLKTGDIGVFDECGHLRIVDRKGSVFKLSSGCKVTPAPIEDAFRSLPWVDQVQVLGRGRRRPVAIVWMDRAGIRQPTHELKGQLVDAVQTIDRRMHPAQYLLIERPAELSLGEITPTQKVRRAHNERAYARYFTEDPAGDDIVWHSLEGVAAEPAQREKPAKRVELETAARGQ